MPIINNNPLLMFEEIMVIYPESYPKHKAKCSFLMLMHVVDILTTGVNTKNNSIFVGIYLCYDIQFNTHGVCDFRHYLKVSHPRCVV